MFLLHAVGSCFWGYNRRMVTGLVVNTGVMGNFTLFVVTHSGCENSLLGNILGIPESVESPPSNQVSIIFSTTESNSLSPKYNPELASI